MDQLDPVSKDVLGSRWRYTRTPSQLWGRHGGAALHQEGRTPGNSVVSRDLGTFKGLAAAAARRCSRHTPFGALGAWQMAMPAADGILSLRHVPPVTAKAESHHPELPVAVSRSSWGKVMDRERESDACPADSTCLFCDPRGYATTTQRLAGVQTVSRGAKPRG